MYVQQTAKYLYLIRQKHAGCWEIRRIKNRRSSHKHSNLRLDAETAEAVKAAAGENAVRIAQFIAGRKNVSEAELAQRTRLDIHHVRTLLYRLHSSSLADYKRTRDSGNGAYASYWTFNKANAEQLFVRLHHKKLQQIRKRLEEEAAGQGFYICPDACTRAEFATAMQQNFKCGECGQVLQQEDNARTIGFLKEKIREMEAAAISI